MGHIRGYVVTAVIALIAGFGGATAAVFVFADQLQGPPGATGSRGLDGAPGPRGPRGPEPQAPILYGEATWADVFEGLDSRVADLEHQGTGPACLPTTVVTDVSWWGDVNPVFPLNVETRSVCLPY